MRRIWLWRVTNLVGFFYLIKGFVHCDLKLQNILMFDNGKIKIADFGLVKKEEQKQSNELPAESINHNGYKSSADIWAC